MHTLRRGGPHLTAGHTCAIQRKALVILLCASFIWALAAGRPALAAPLQQDVVPSEESQADSPSSLFLPVIGNAPDFCEPIPGTEYGSLPIDGEPTDRPAASHADLNLGLRGYVAVPRFNGLIELDGPTDPHAPKLTRLFGDQRIPYFAGVYSIYDWDWESDTRTTPLDQPPVTLAGLRVSPQEPLYLPTSGYSLGDGYEALVLYASTDRITLKYTREDNVTRGYTLHVEGICVDPNLLALYEGLNAAGRSSLPALCPGEVMGYARGTEIGVAIRDCGSFMDPRSRKDWWRETIASEGDELAP